MKHADAAGVRIAWDDRGSASRGPAFLCLPGWCVNRGFFDPLAAQLSARHRVLTLDWRGHGDSDKPTTDFGHARLLDDALAVLDASGADTVVPIAQAHGAWIALELRR